MTTKQYMQVVKTPHPDASRILLKTLPGFIGDEDVNVACGECKTILAKGVSMETFARQASTPYQMLLVCPQCGAENELPSQTFKGVSGLRGKA